MGRKTQEFKPNAILATSVYTGLSALVRLANKIQNEQRMNASKNRYIVNQNADLTIGPK